MKYRFGDLEIDLHAATLKSGDQVIATQRLTFDTLVFLVQNRGRVVTRDELLRGPWRGIFVSDGAINQTISLVRKALATSSETSARIETVRGRGFQFVGDVVCDAPERIEAASAVHRPRNEPWVERSQSLGALMEAYDRTLGGAGALVVVAGEPGIGKTTLLREFIARLDTRGAWVAWGDCVERRGSSPFEPWLEIVAKLLDRPSITARDEVLRARAGIDPLFPELAGRLGLAKSATGMQTSGMRRVAFDAVGRFVHALSREQPIVLVFEDVHAADDDSYELIRAAVAMWTEARVLVICTARDTEAPTSRIVRELLAEETSTPRTIVRIDGLDPSESRTLIERVLPIEATATVDRVASLTNGNPFLIHEFARAYRASGSMASVDALLDSFRVPDRVGDTIRHNVAVLPDETQRALSAAAIVGRDFELAVVAAMLSEPPAKTSAAFQPALEVGWIHEVTRLRFAFRHALVRESLLAGMAAADRAALNHRAAEALGSTGAGTDASLLARMAFHYSLAAPFGDPMCAVDHECLAARAATSRLAYRDAASHYERALEALSLGTDDIPRRMAILLDLARAARDGGNRPRALEVCERVTNLARSIGDWRVFARAVVFYGDTQTELIDPTLLGLCEEALAGLPPDALELRALVLTRLSVISNFMMMWDRRDAAVREALALAARLEDDNVRAHALQAQRWCMDAMHPPVEALRVSTEAVAVADRVGEATLANEMRRWKFSDHLRMGQRDAALGALAAHRDAGMRLQEPWHHAWDLRMATTLALMEARLDDADRLATETLLAGQEAGDSLSVFLYWVVVMLLRREQGRAEEAEPFTRQAIELLPWNPAWKCGLAIILAESERLDAAREQLAVLVADDCASIPPDMNALTARTMLAEVAVMVGDREAGEILYRQLAPHAQRANVIAAGIAADTPVDTVLALLAMLLGRYDEAERHLDDADRLCEGLKATLWILRARQARAHVRWRAGKRAEAIAMLASVLVDADRLRIVGIDRSSARSEPDLHTGARSALAARSDR